MSINYLDTVTMYYVCHCDMQQFFTTHWISDTTNDDSNFHYFFIRAGYIYIRYFPCLYGKRYLYVTFSLPKMYNNCNSNVFNVKNYDNNTFMDRLTSSFSTVMDISQLPKTLSKWQPSRIDLFRMKVIKSADRMEYKYAYSRLIYRGRRTRLYKNTNYLPSSASTNSSVIFRSYNKTIEQQDKRSISSGNLPEMVERQHESMMGCEEMSPELYRYEFSVRRSALRRFCKKHGLSLNMETFMSEDVQKVYLNELAESRGLFLDILSKKEYCNIVKKIFPRQNTRQQALTLAEYIRNDKSFPIKDHQRYRIQHKLKSLNISTATSNFVSIKGLKRL